MAELLELFGVAVAFAIYGTQKHPRHWPLRFGLRLFVFAGLACTATFLIMDADPWPVPEALTALWGSAGLTLLMAEHDIGSRKVAAGAWISAACLSVLALVKLT